MIKFIPWMDNGFEVIGSTSTPEFAANKILEVQPDVVFCDLNMPRMDGNQMIAVTREQDYISPPQNHTN